MEVGLNSKNDYKRYGFSTVAVAVVLVLLANVVTRGHGYPTRSVLICMPLRGSTVFLEDVRIAPFRSTILDDR